MNKENSEKIDQDCNVCGSAIEVGSAWSQCSNRHCPTRVNDSSLSTDATANDVFEYFDDLLLDHFHEDEADSAIEQYYRKFLSADSHDDTKELEGAVNALLSFSSYSGWGELRLEVDE
jgi:hypothetical protein